MKFFPFFLALIFSLPIKAETFVGSSQPANAILPGSTLVEMPPECNRNTQKTVWRSGGFTCLSDGYQKPAPQPVVRSGGGACSQYTAWYERLNCQRWNNNLARKGGQPFIGGLVRAPGLSYSAARNCQRGSACEQRRRTVIFGR